MSEKQQNLLTISLIFLSTFLALGNLWPRFTIRNTPIKVEKPNITVAISGAVELPGVYELPWGSRLTDLITKAGGLRYDAESTLINSAELLDTGSNIFIPYATLYKGESLISINSATQAELETLPGIGPSTASKIIRSRPYNRLEDLLRVSGIGEKTLDRLRPLIKP